MDANVTYATIAHYMVRMLFAHKGHQIMQRDEFEAKVQELGNEVKAIDQQLKDIC